MSTDLVNLGHRAVSCSKWRWMPGMQVVHTPEHDGATGFFMRLSDSVYKAAASEYPDFSDPATLGCLLALVRDANSNPAISTTQSEYVDRGFEWSVMIHVREGRMLTCEFLTGKTEAEALVAALEKLSGN